MPGKALNVNLFGGINTFDQKEILVQKSFAGGTSQQFPLETDDLQNMDLDPTGIHKRNGSTLIDDITLTTETALDGTIFEDAQGVLQHIVVCTTSIYRKVDGGAWAKLTDIAGATYAHAATVSKCTFLALDGHLFIGLDGANYIQVYRAGTALDDELNTTGSGTPASPTYYLSVLNTHDYTTPPAGPATGDRYLNTTTATMYTAEYIYEWNGAAWDETIPAVNGVVYNETTGLGVQYSGSAWTTATVYREAYTNTPNKIIVNAMTGVWEQGAYILASLHTRLIYSAGNNLLEYTPVADVGIWGRGTITGGFHSPGGPVVMLVSYVPFFQDQVNELLYIGTGNGMEVLTGFESTDRMIRLNEATAPVNHRAYVISNNWLIYLTRDASLKGISGQTVIDLGRRAKNHQFTGPLDLLNYSTATVSLPFGYYNRWKRQAYFYFPSGAATTNDTAIVLDFSLGEPQVGEGEQSFEQRTRVLLWKKKSADWLTGVYTVPSRSGDASFVGIHSTGETFDVETGINDFTDGVKTTAIEVEAHWDFPRFNAGSFSRKKQWYRSMVHFFMRDTSGSPTDTVITEYYFDDAAAVGRTETKVLDNTAAKDVQLVYDVYSHSDVIRVRIKNYTSLETFTMINFLLEFDHLAESVRA